MTPNKVEELIGEKRANKGYKNNLRKGQIPFMGKKAGNKDNRLSLNQRAQKYSNISPFSNKVRDVSPFPRKFVQEISP